MRLADRRVMVLNRMWVAVNVCSLQRAIKMLWGENGVKARVIDPTNEFQTYTWEDWSRLRPKEGEDIIRGVSDEYRVPEVILLTDYDKMPHQRGVKFSRRMIYKRDNYQCQYCGKHVEMDEVSIDHVVPRSHGGPTTWENCVLACVKCNARKNNRTPKQAGMKLLKEPVKPKINLTKADRHVIPRTWQHFISECYWSIELENDN